MKDTIHRVKLLGSAILALLALIIILQNTESVETRILFMTVVMPRAALLFVTLLIGFLSGALTAFWMSRRNT